MGLFGKDDRKPASSQLLPEQRSTPSPAPVPQSKETTVIGRGSRLEGTLAGSADMLIEGKVNGALEGTGRVVVAEAGVVEANLHARIVVVAGEVTGNVSAEEKIELQASATLKGNITAPRILIQEGATFEGEVRMAKPEKKATVPAREQAGKAPEQAGTGKSSTRPKTG